MKRVKAHKKCLFFSYLNITHAYCAITISPLTFASRKQRKFMTLQPIFFLSSFFCVLVEDIDISWPKLIVVITLVALIDVVILKISYLIHLKHHSLHVSLQDLKGILKHSEICSHQLVDMWTVIHILLRYSLAIIYKLVIVSLISLNVNLPLIATATSSAIIWVFPRLSLPIIPLNSSKGVVMSIVILAMKHRILVSICMVITTIKAKGHIGVLIIKLIAVTIDSEINSRMFNSKLIVVSIDIHCHIAASHNDSIAIS